MAETMNLDLLPDVVLEQVLSYSSFDEIARYRRVSTKFNIICKSMLNKGFRAVEKYHTKCLKDVKGKLPRRESERRDHPLARHCDILTAIETRISLLGMTFMKYVDLDLCCFIPGKVIDEIYSVLRKIQHVKNPSRSCEVLQELRDISSMAMEYFDEKIVPSLRVKLPLSPVRLSNGSYFSSIFTSGTGFSLSMRYSDGLSPPGTPLCRIPLQQPASEPTHRSRPSFTVGSGGPSSSPAAGTPARKPANKASKLVRDLKRQADSYKSAVEAQNKKMLELDRRIDQQNEIINEQNARLAEQEEKLAEMSRRLVENTSQFTDINKDKGTKVAAGLSKALLPVACGSGSGAVPEVELEVETSLTKPRKRGRASDAEEEKQSPKRGRKSS